MPDPFSFVARFYDRFAGRPDPGPLPQLLDLRPGRRLLDLGGGTGRLVQSLDGVRLVVGDLAAGMVRQAHGKGLPACQSRAEALPFGDGTFHSILVSDAFHHFADQRRAVGEMLRVLRPGGRLVIQEPDIRRPGARLVSWGERLLGMSSRMLAPAELGALLSHHSGQVLAIQEIGFSFRLVATRQEIPS